MLTEHAKVMALLKDAGEVVGRKKLQKMVYISKKMKLPFQERYNFHMFGPYSEELTLRVEELSNLGFVKEVKEKKAGYYQYRYALTEDGETFLKKFPLEWPDEKAKGMVESMNTHPSKFLELVSTILYFDDLPKAEVKEKVFTLKKKQNYSEEDIEEAYHYIHSLKH
ncbi:YwgA family protein [Bacillus sp. FJAT-44742]|uniref:YwgA family protein n=1 Tax=Bacillus sp. FJAT-44742 TaxID=2014005 RepID=UPI000C2364B0|nr:hypothetical protein [Bacillus sp. FJAT-44742]